MPDSELSEWDRAFIASIHDQIAALLALKDSGVPPELAVRAAKAARETAAAPYRVILDGPQ